MPKNARETYSRKENSGGGKSKLGMDQVVPPGMPEPVDVEARTGPKAFHMNVKTEKSGRKGVATSKY